MCYEFVYIRDDFHLANVSLLVKYLPVHTALLPRGYKCSSITFPTIMTKIYFVTN